MPAKKIVTKKNTRQKQGELRKKAILEAAFEHFTQKGFALTRMEDIAAQAEVSKGSIYNYFTSKEALLEALVKEHVVSMLPEKIPATTSPANIVDFTRTALTRVVKQAADGDAGKLLHLIISEGERFPKIAEMYYKTVVLVALEKITTMLKIADKHGLLVNPDLVKFPQLMATPILQAMIWSKLFAKLQPIDFEAMLKVYLNTIFIVPKQEVVKNEQ